MNHVIILAGGVGSRMKSDIPKQFLLVKGLPLFMYSFRKFVSFSGIGSIVLVVSEDWLSFVQEQVKQEKVDIPVLFALAGKSRQHSVRNGLTALADFAEEQDPVFVHDSVRPLFPLSNITDGLAALETHDAALPVISVKDATYQSCDGNTLSAILPRSELYSGQSPECFRYGDFVRAHEPLTDIELAGIRGCSELAFRAGLRVKLIPGTEQNFKITTPEDLQALTLIL